MPFTQSTALKIYYERQGEGVPVLYISGTGADLRNKPNVLDGPLPKHADVVAYDQRGLGQTMIPEGPYTMVQYADDALDLMAGLGWARAHVIGVSFGGMVALNLAARHPQVIDKLVLCCTSPGGSAPSYPFHQVPAHLSEAERARFLLGINDTRRDSAWQAENAERVEKMIEYTVSKRALMMSDPTSRAGAHEQLLARAGHDVEAALGAMAMPTLICAGRYDDVASPANQEKMAQAMPNARLQWYEGGHLFMVQDKQAWSDIIGFLTGGDASG